MLIKQNEQYFKADDNGVIINDDKGVPVAATAEEIKSFEDSQKKPEVDTDLEKLAKDNPAVAKALAEKQKLEADLAKIKSDEEKKRQDEAKKTGQFQQLYEESEKKRKEIEENLNKANRVLGGYKSTVEVLLDEALKQIPADKQALIPKEYSARKKLEYIRENSKILGVEVLIKKGSPVPPNEDTPPASEELKLGKEIDELIKKSNKTLSENNILWEKTKQLKTLRNKKS